MQGIQVGETDDAGGPHRARTQDVAGCNLRHMAKTVFIGAGSTVFARNLLGDILGYEELAGSEIVLHDIDTERLDTSALVAHRVCEALNAPAKITATTDRRAALDGADYAINMIQVGGYEPCTVTDFEVPKRFDLRQTIGDTIGIGGIMRGLRTIPVLLSMCADMEELCPDVWLLNYTNPMAMNCRAVNRASEIRTVGLCHSVQGTAFELSHDLGIAYGEIDYLAAGINHMAFYLRLERDGEDLYPRPGQPGALRNAAPDRLLRDRVERALRRVRSVVHQARPTRSHRAFQRTAG